MKSIYIYGASGHGLVVADIARACGYEDIIFVDDGENLYSSFEDIKNQKETPFALGIGSNKTRENLLKKLKDNNFNIVSLIHPSSIISPSVIIGEGTVILPNVVINTNTQIGKGVILNTSCVIEHENIIEDFVHISPLVALAGDVKVGKLSHIGIASCSIQGVSIGKNCIIGAGSVIINDIKDNIKAYGNPCKTVEDINE